MGRILELVGAAFTQHRLYVCHFGATGIFYFQDQWQVAKYVFGSCAVFAVFFHIPLRSGVFNFRTRNLLARTAYVVGALESTQKQGHVCWACAMAWAWCLHSLWDRVWFGRCL